MFGFLWHWFVGSSSNSIYFQAIELLQNITTVVCAGGWKRTAFSLANSTNMCTPRRAFGGWTQPKGWRMYFVATTRSSWVTGWVPPQLSLFGTKPLTSASIGPSICDGEHRSNLVLSHKEEIYATCACQIQVFYVSVANYHLYSIVGSSSSTDRTVKQKSWTVNCTMYSYFWEIYTYVCFCAMCGTRGLQKQRNNVKFKTLEL